jgi:hypothetical protein
VPPPPDIKIVGPVEYPELVPIIILVTTPLTTLAGNPE